MTKQIKEKKKIQRQFEGEVVKAKANKTISVLVIEHKLHPKYQKRYQVSRKYPVHDEKGEAKEGDRIIFVECRPLSKTKRWRFLKKVS